MQNLLFQLPLPPGRRKGLVGKKKNKTKKKHKEFRQLFNKSPYHLAGKKKSILKIKVGEN